MLQPGDPAPDVEARNQHGDLVAPDFDDVTVVYFYPKDETPGCTIEAEEFGREADAYADAGVAIYGVSTDDVEAHRAFAEKEGIEFDLLADPEADIAAAFGVPLDDRGRARRTTFVLGDGEVLRVYESVDPDGHAREVLGDLLDDGVVAL